MDKLYPHEVSASERQIVGRILRPQSWHDNHNDPCDEIDFDVMLYYWLQTTKDMQMRSRIKTLLNMQFGKFNDNINHRYGKMGVKFNDH